MTGCRGKGRASAALALVLVLAAPAAAQIGPPIRLGPGAQDSGTDSTGDNPLLAPVPRSDAPVERAPLPPIAIAPAPAATEVAPTPPDETVQDTARSPLEPILAQLPLRIPSPAARALVVRALAGGRNEPGPRAVRLLAMGDAADA